MLPIPPGIMASHDGALSGQDSSQAEMMSEMCILVDSSDGKIGSDTKFNRGPMIKSHFHLSGPIHVVATLLTSRVKMGIRQREQLTLPGGSFPKS